MGKHCNAPRMIVDHSGTIHAVWSLMITQQYRKIMYAKSENQGDTWSVPIAIANDSSQWFDGTDIACDLQNRLYVSYEGDDMAPSTTSIYMTIFDGSQWSTPSIISVNMYGSNNSIVVSDNAGRVYCFWHNWYNNEVKLIYKYLEDGLWSQSIIPYTQNGEFFWIKKIVADSANNLHCVGTHHYNDESRYDDRVIYCYYLRSSNQWAPIENISDTINYSWHGSDICLDNQQVPHFVWGQFLNPYPNPVTNNATLYRFPNESGWLPVDSVEVDHNSHNHQLVIDKTNQSNICVNQWTNVPNQPSNSYLVNYRNINNIWIGEEIDSITPGAFYEPQLISLGDENIGVIYYKGGVSNDTVLDIHFSKYNIFTNIKPNELSAINMLITPNPFTTQTEISYTVNTQCQVLLDIFDINGKLITRLTDQTQSPGQYCILWQGVGANAKEVSKGLYFVRLQAGSNVYTCKIAKQ
jgi:hypothetical protein